MIITFSGTDGAGKSTQISYLEKYLSKEKKKYITLWARGGYTPIFSFIKKIIRLISVNKLPEPGPNKSRGKLLNNKFVAKLWLSLATIDLIIFYGIYARTLSILRVTVICDRYIEDTELDFKNNFQDFFSPKSFLWRAVNFIAPKPDSSFLLIVPVEISIERSIEKNEPFPNSNETLHFRYNSYMDKKIFPDDKYFRINCSQSLLDIHSEIINKANL